MMPVPFMVKISLRRLASGFAFSLLLSSSAFAADGKIFIQSLESSIKPYGLILNYKDLDVKGSAITLSNVRLLQKNGADAPALPIYLGTVHFDGITAEQDGSFTIGKIIAGEDSAAASADNRSDTGAVTIADMEVRHARLSSAGGGSVPYQNTLIKNITYQVRGKTLLSLNGISAQYSQKAAGVYENISKIQSFAYEPASWPGTEGQQAKLMLSALGYTTIRGSFFGSTLWDTKKGDVDIAEYRLSAENMGSLTLKGTLSGVSRDFADACQKLALRQTEQPNLSNDAQRKLNQEAVSLAGRLGIGSLSLVYKDDSLAGRILDYMSTSAAKPRAALVAALKVYVLANAQSFQNTDFAVQAANQINAFLDSPRSLQLSARPQNPIALSSVLLTASFAPEQLSSLLSLDIAANK